MAGDESSTDILEGLNQVVTAINDLLIQASCTPQVNVTCDGTGGGTEGPSQGGTEAGTPPSGWSDPPDLFGTPEYNTRKCKIANAIHENLIDWLTLWQTYEVDGFASAFLTISLISLLGALIGEISTPVPLIDGVIGFVIGFLSGVAIAVIQGSFNLTTILALMATHEQALICALYQATTTQDAIDDYLQVLDDNGASAGDLLLLSSIVVIDLLNNLFFKKGEAVDDALSGYTPPLACTGCTVCPEVFTLWGTQTGDNSWDSEFIAGLHHIDLKFNWDDGASDYCRGNVLITATITSGTPYWQSGGNKTFRIQDQGDNTVYNSHTPPSAVSGAQTFFWSTTAFSLDVTWSNP